LEQVYKDFALDKCLKQPLLIVTEKENLTCVIKTTKYQFRKKQHISNKIYIGLIFKLNLEFRRCFSFFSETVASKTHKNICIQTNIQCLHADLFDFSDAAI